MGGVTPDSVVVETDLAHALYSVIINWRKFGIDPMARIAANRERIKGRIEPWEGEPKMEPCAVVGYGPSLQETWTELKHFKTIFTCSGGYRFLRERGIIAPYHCETDPQKHKVRNLGEPSPQTTFYVGSHCDPNYFDLLEMYDARIVLFHISLMGFPLVGGEWTLNCSGTAGHYTFTLARFLGWRDFHFFGFDHSSRERAVTHAGKHDGIRHDLNYHEVDGLYTTNNWVGHIKTMFDIIDAAGPTITYKFYGDGLMQRMDRARVKKTLPVRTPMGVFGA